VGKDKDIVVVGGWVWWVWDVIRVGCEEGGFMRVLV